MGNNELNSQLLNSDKLFIGCEDFAMEMDLSVLMQVMCCAVCGLDSTMTNAGRSA